jgi:SagB-type dehydrogenase family enzyme
MNMKKIYSVVLMVVMFLVSIDARAQDTDAIVLSSQRTDNGVTLLKALQLRRTERSFSSKELTVQELSDLLWAANGINRPSENLRTAPSTMNLQEIDIYVAMKNGLYLYDARSNVLKRILAQDIRTVTGLQPFVKDAPINLIFVADFSKMGKLSASDASFYAATDTGFISQNVYLHCASVGLATVVRGWFDKPRLTKVMNLRKDQKIILTQTVGYPLK